MPLRRHCWQCFCIVTPLRTAVPKIDFSLQSSNINHLGLPLVQSQKAETIGTGYVVTPSINEMAKLSDSEKNFSDQIASQLN